MKGMADALHDLGCPVSDRVLVLNVLRGLSSTYDHLKSWIACQRPFPSFLQVRDDCRRLEFGAIGHTSMGGGAFYYIGPAGLALQGKGNSLDLHLLTIATNP